MTKSQCRESIWTIDGVTLLRNLCSVTIKRSFPLNLCVKNIQSSLAIINCCSLLGRSLIFSNPRPQQDLHFDIFLFSSFFKEKYKLMFSQVTVMQAGDTVSYVNAPQLLVLTAGSTGTIFQWPQGEGGLLGNMFPE